MSDSLERARASPRPCARPAAARSSSAAGCAIGCSASTPRTSTSRCSASRPIGCARLLESFGRVEAVGESFQVYKMGDIDVVAAPPRSKAGRGHRGFDVTGDPSMSLEEAARRRDFTVNAIAWDPLTDEYLDPFDGRRDLDAPALRVVDPDDVRRRQPARAARDSVRRAVRSRRSTRHGEALPRHAARRPAGRTDLGRIRKAAARRRSRRSASRSRWSSASSPSCFRNCRRSPAVRRSPSGIPRATCGCTRCRSSTRRDSASTISPRPQQIAVMLGARLPRLRQAARRRRSIDGRIRSIDHEEQGVAPATAFLDRLNVHSIDGYDVRRQVLGLVAQHLKPGIVVQGARRGRRRRVPAARAEGRPRAAGAPRQGRLPGPRARPFRLQRDGLVSRARARARRRASAAGADPARTPPARARPHAGPAGRRDSEGGLRAADGWNGHDLDEAIAAADNWSSRHLVNWSVLSLCPLPSALCPE